MPIEWQRLGLIRLNGDLSNVPTKPGLYKLVFVVRGKTYGYIGHAGKRKGKGLQARIGDYACNPSQGNKMEHLLFDLLKEAGEAELSISCVGVHELEKRTDFEATAINAARQQGLKCINKGDDRDDIWMQRFRLESEKRMLKEDLTRVKDKLARLPPLP